MNNLKPDNDLIPSKTQLKTQMHELQELGEQLSQLSVSALKRLSLPDELLDALLACQQIKSNGALKRQRQYIGRLMRNIDPEPIRQYFLVRQGESNAHNAWLHRIERCRESLLANDAELQELIKNYPTADIQQLRLQIRNARKELLENKPPKHTRALFQSLKSLLPEPTNQLLNSTQNNEEVK